MNYTLGLDIGITSIGFCVVNDDEVRIETLGVRIFNAAEHPKTGDSLAKPRRIARGRRKTLRRKAHRLQRIRELFIEYGLAKSLDEIKAVYTDDTIQDPWTLRVKALDKKLNAKQWIKVLTQIAKRRGFKSNRKSELKDEETGKMYAGINENKLLMKEKGYRTVGELFVKDEKFVFVDGYFIKNRRNRGEGNYTNSISRDLLIEELGILFETQRSLKNKFASEDFQNKYMKIFESQRPFATEDDIEKLLGKCTFEKEEKRAAKACYTSELFVALTKLNNLRLTDKTHIELTTDEKAKIIEMIHDKKEIKYSHIRKELNLPKEVKFVGVDYYSPKSKKENVKYLEMKAYHEIKEEITKKLGVGSWNNINKKDKLDIIGTVLTIRKTDADIIKDLKQYYFDDKIIDVLLNISFSKVQHLSLKAMNKLLPYLEEGHVYNVACSLAGYNHSQPNGEIEKQYKLPVIDEEYLTNPVFKRAITQTRKVINAVIDKYGSPTQINVEVVRELSKSFKDRKEIEKHQKLNAEERQRAINQIQETFDNSKPKGLDILKWRLWREQGEICMYSGKQIKCENLFNVGYVEIDHIIPYSRSFDDSMSNKVLVMQRENQNKKNRIPAEYFGLGTEKWAGFSLRVENSKLSHRKKTILLKNEFTEEDEEGWKERNLNDTKYISKFMSSFIKENLLFKESEHKQKVRMVPGQLTGMLRGRWGLNKNREEGDLHHALDAAVIATVTQGFIQRISKFSAKKELYNETKEGRYIDKVTREIVDTKYKQEHDKYFPLPWPEFIRELKARLLDNPASMLEKMNLPNYLGVDLNTIKPVFISRMPYRKVTGQIHEETVRSAKFMETTNKSTIKKRLTELTYDSLEKMVDKDRNKVLYNALKERLLEYNGDSKKAFGISNPFYKPTKDGTRGPIVRGITIEETQNTGVIVCGGIADNGKMVRVDIFKKGKNYFIVPVYVKDIMKGELPNRAIAAHKLENEWSVIDETFEFCFTLYKNDLLYVKKKNFEMFGYYNSAHRGVGTLEIQYHDRSKRKEDISIKTGIIELKKYYVDILGNKYEVKGETRIGLENFNSK